MYLIIDVGNTLNKIAVFDRGALVHKKVSVKTAFLEAINQVSKAYPMMDNCIISSVGKLSEASFSMLDSLFKVKVLTHESKIPFKNLYETPTTLGVDRIALVAAAAVQFPKKNVLVIDAGSAITYDFLTDKNNYIGGAIAPGIAMRYKALHNFTENLPLLKKIDSYELIGTTTDKAIHSGVLEGVLLEIDGVINAYKKEYPNLTIILTGGDTDFLRDRLKNDIFANSNFLLEGLNHILEHNID
ncbi:type III pantothenate kinase [Patiriisocius marinistellae]|uniref:Type III pantothenate kinase n=1 Tax=Patiriisocius marinistellae TaxID=2494560 RepID=A0A5J4G021_9FLAO|nr:type III pantothenate kinase [Patiriisocius marinistellae]GEQ85351.1 type III pantothenate kinase [Patiriisocius marinistellae]